MIKHLYILIFLCVATTVQAQKKPVADTTVEILATNTILHADPRLDIVLKKTKQTGGGSGIYSGRGYRVQIYAGNDRSKAAKTKIDFQRRFPGVYAYMTYVSPQFRVKVGDFRSRGEAQEMYSKLSTLYTPCMIVPDIVVFRNINTHKEKDDRSNTD
jgi:hypothetical protein